MAPVPLTVVSAPIPIAFDPSARRLTPMAIALLPLEIVEFVAEEFGPIAKAPLFFA